MKKGLARVATIVLAPFAVACGGAPLGLHAPEIAVSEARVDPATIELDPIATRSPAGVVLRVPSGESIEGKPEPAAVLTAAMRAELKARALRGDRGEGGAYAARCTLDRFAVRDEAKVAGAGRMAALYVDATCEVERSADHALVWRGVLRGRASAAETTSPLASTTPVVQLLVDRMLSDAAREMASDLAIRALGLAAGPSARVFANDAARASLGGIDDGPLGNDALAERITPEVLAATRDESAATRAAAWNAIAMASDRPPNGDAPIALDDDERVRFYQYKALGRVGTPAALAQLRAAASTEADTLLVELAQDVLASHGIGLARRANATRATNGATTRP